MASGMTHTVFERIEVFDSEGRIARLEFRTNDRLNDPAHDYPAVTSFDERGNVVRKEFWNDGNLVFFMDGENVGALRFESHRHPV